MDMVRVNFAGRTLLFVLFYVSLSGARKTGHVARWCSLWNLECVAILVALFHKSKAPVYVCVVWRSWCSAKISVVSPRVSCDRGVVKMCRCLCQGVALKISVSALKKLSD